MMGKGLLLSAATLLMSSGALAEDCNLTYTVSKDKTYAIVSGASNRTTCTELNIPEKYEGLPVKEISTWALAGIHLEHIILPEGLETIGVYALRGSLSGNVVIPNSVKTVGYGAFAAASRLTGVIFSENSQLEILEGGVFYANGGLQTIILPPNFQFEPDTILDLQHTHDLQNLYLTPEQAENISITGKSSNFAPKVYQINEDGITVSQNGREMNKYGSFSDMISGEWSERYEYSEDKKYGGLRQETYAKDGENDKYIGAKIFRPDGSIVLVDENNKFINKLHAKIYTVEEAMAVTRDGNVNRVRLTYK